jgi:hypothetical protein
MIKLKSKQKNPKFLEKLKKTLKGLRGTKYECAVGFPLGDAQTQLAWYDSGQSILQVAVQNEYGIPGRIPSRPFMQQAAPAIHDMYDKASATCAPAIADGKLTVRKFMKTAGQAAVKIIQDSIDNGNFAPNAPSTIRAKKSSKPLMDSGDMRKYVTFVIREKAE